MKYMYEGANGYIFDLDGTLYDFGGVKFADSLLGKSVKTGFLRVIASHGVTDVNSKYNEFLEREWREKVGTSIQVAELIGSTREAVLSDIWGGVDPSSVLMNYEHSKQVIPLLGSENHLFLVTAAPKIWAHKALEYMQLKEYFLSILTLEDYGHSKAEAFRKISENSKIPLSRMISIGDQEHSDIVPAQEIGMQTLHVSGPQDLYKLLA